MLKHDTSTPLVPVMSEDELQLFIRHIPSDGSVLEFGAGGSTRLLAEKSVSKIYSVESDMEWIKRMLHDDTIRKAFAGKRIFFVHADIGPTGGYGHPESQNPEACWLDYSRGVWPHITTEVAYVLIDGRFRVACTLQSILRLNEDTVYFIHDFNNREHYHIILEYLDVLGEADTAVACRAKKNIDWKKLCLTLQSFELDPR